MNNLLFSLSLLLLLLVITIDSSPGVRRDETQVKKPCTKPTKPKPVEPTTTTTEKPIITSPIGKKSCKSKISKECQKVNVGTDSNPQYRQKCRKVRIDSATKKTTVLGDWEYEDGSNEMNNDAVDNKSSAEENSTSSGSGDGSKQCEKVNVGTKNHPKYRKRCRKVKVDSVTKRRTEVGEWQYEDEDDEDAEKADEGKIETISNPDGSYKQCKKVNVGTKSQPKYRKKCRKVKVDSVDKKTTHVGDWEYEDEDEDEKENRTTKKPARDSSEEQIDIVPGSGGFSKQCKNFNVGTKSHPKYRKKCRKVKVDSATKKTTVVGDWEYEDGDDADEKNQSSNENSGESSGSNENDKQRTTQLPRPNPRTTSKPAEDSSEEQTDIIPGSDGVSKQCKNFNVGTKYHPKYRKKCRKVKVDSATKKTTVVGDWEYEDDDDEKNQSSDEKSGSNETGNRRTTPSPRSKPRPTNKAPSDSSEENTGSGEISKQCEKVKLGSKSHPIYRKKCRKVKVDSATKKTTVISDWEYEDSNSEEKAPVDNDDEENGGYVRIDDAPQGSGKKPTDEISKQCEKVNVGSQKHPKYRKRCRKVKVDSATKKTTVVGDWEYEDEDEKENRTTKKPTSDSSEEQTGKDDKSNSQSSSSGEDTDKSGQENSKENNADSSKKNETQKQCEKVNVGTKSQRKYRKRCRMVKVDSATKRTTQVGDWKYEDDDSEENSKSQSSSGQTSEHSGQENPKENGEIQKQCEKVNVGSNSQPKYRKRCRKVKVDNATKKTTVVGDWEYEDDDSEKKSGETRTSSGQETSQNGDDDDSGRFIIQKQCAKMNVGTKEHPLLRNKCRKVKIDRVTKKTTVIGDWEYEDADDDDEEESSTENSYEDDDVVNSEPRTNTKSEGDGHSERKVVCENVNIGTAEHPKIRKRCRNEETIRITERNTTTTEWDYEDGKKSNTKTQTKTQTQKSKFSRKSRNLEERSIQPESEEYDDEEYQSEESDKITRKLADDSEGYYDDEDDDQDDGYDDEEYYDNDEDENDNKPNMKYVRKQQQRTPFDSYSTDYYSYEV